MPRISLPDGSVRTYEKPVTAAEVATDIGARLGRDAIGALIDGELSDLSATIAADAALVIVTPTNREGESSADALWLIRHSAAHVMAEAIGAILPGVQLVYGPPVDGGFYYDLFVPAGRALSAEDFPAIEARMGEIIAADRPFTRSEMSVADGIRKLRGEGSKYKLDNAERAVAAGAERLTWYATGEPGRDFEDLCRGPHVPSTGRIGAFKVMSLATSHWHGDASSDALTRVYGTAFATPEQLQHHLDMLDEARKRDHRRLGRQLDLFAFDDAVGPGLALWTPRGSVVRRELEEFIRGELIRRGYDPVYTPHIGRLDLYRTSGHFPYYRDSQFPPLIDHEQIKAFAAAGESCAALANRLEKGELDGYLLKPMNCPHHAKIYASRPRSYRDLPLRLCEFGTVYRWEQSGEVGGLTRVRGFTQDDAHLFCTEEQLPAEMQGCLDLVTIIFGTLGMRDYRVRVGLRDPASDKYIGDPANWDKAEQACRDAASSLGVPFTEEAGEAAFYGPKIDFMVKDVIGRQWQLGTVQVDYNLPRRFDLTYIGADNEAHRPVVVHRAPFGSMERFVGVLIEHFAGAFPAWLAPEQVRVLPLSEKTDDYGSTVHQLLRRRGVRATLDHSQARIEARVRIASDWKIPYQLIVGPKEAAAQSVAVRALGIPRPLGTLPLEVFADSLQREISSRGETSVVREHFETAMV